MITEIVVTGTNIKYVVIYCQYTFTFIVLNFKFDDLNELRVSYVSSSIKIDLIIIIICEW